MSTRAADCYPNRSRQGGHGPTSLPIATQAIRIAQGKLRPCDEILTCTLYYSFCPFTTYMLCKPHSSHLSVVLVVLVGVEGAACHEQLVLCQGRTGTPATDATGCQRLLGCLHDLGWCFTCGARRSHVIRQAGKTGWRGKRTEERVKDEG